MDQKLETNKQTSKQANPWKINQPEQYGKFNFKSLVFDTAVSSQNHGLVIQNW